MNWENFSEKLTSNGEAVIIFCDEADKTNDFVLRKMATYKSRGKKVKIKCVNKDKNE